MTFPPLIIWAKATFFFEQLFPVVARTWLEYKSGSLFLGPKFRFLVQKSNFCHTTPILVDGPFLALGMTGHAGLFTIQCAVGGSVDGCGARAVSRKTPIYFMSSLVIFWTHEIMWMHAFHPIWPHTSSHICNHIYHQLVRIVFGQALDQMGQKCWYLAQNASFGPNLAVFGPKIQFFGGRE